MRAITSRDSISTQRILFMTKPSFRLTYIKARRPSSVDGLGVFPNPALVRDGWGRLARGRTDSCRAIHWCNNESHTLRAADDSPDCFEHTFLLGQVDHRPQRNCAERLNYRRISGRVCRDKSLPRHDKCWRYDAGNCDVAGLAKSTAVSADYVGI